MHINVIDTIKQLEDLREDWTTVYSADPHVTIHRSWPWIRAWAESTPYDWLVLALRHHTSSPYIAFFPLAKEVTLKNEHKLYMGGHPLSAHTGFVCAPEYAVDAITTFSNFIQKQLKWDIFEMREVFDPRFDVFLSYFSSRKFSLRRISETSCPYIPLPQSWDQYLQDCLSTSARKELRKKIRLWER